MTSAPAPPAALIERVARRAAGLSPLPRGLPFLALDHPSGTALHLLEGLARQGIFRKYEHVLDLDAGLGATSRWIAERLGCTAIATDESIDMVRAGHRLTRQAGLDGQVAHVAAPPGHLPFRDAAFTHVWIVEKPAGAVAPQALLAEAHRVVRPGGHLAAQQIVPAQDEAGEHATADRWRVALAEAGFVDVALRDVSDEALETAPRLLAARGMLATAAERSGQHEIVRDWLAVRARVGAALERRAARLVQLTARRP